jgi:hypothetical protein
MTTGAKDRNGRPPSAHLVHRTAGRMRLRVPTKRNDQVFFADLEERLRQVPRIEKALARPQTAGVLLHFAEGDGDRIAKAIDALDILSIDDLGARATRRLDAIVPNPDNAISLLHALRSGSIDRRKIAFAVFMLLLLHRLLRGGYVAPGLALIWLIYEVWRGSDTDQPTER